MSRVAIACPPDGGRPVARIRDRATFDTLRRAGRRARRGPVVVTFAPVGDDVSRVAYSVGRRIGGAVVRNRLRRRLRAAVADVSGLAPGAYLVGVSPGAKALAYEDLKAQVTRAMTAASRPPPR